MSGTLKRIFLTVSGGGMCNVGDTAMLGAAVTHLRSNHPGAEIGVLVAPDVEPQRQLPGVKGVNGDGREMFFCPGSLIRQFHRFAPEWEARCRTAWPRGSRTIISAKKWITGRSSTVMGEFFDFLLSSDLVVATGGGYINDSFAHHGRSTLDTLEIAADHGIPIALMGQGLGPITQTPLRESLQRVGRRAQLIGLRERRSGVPLLRSLGIHEEQIVVTGDDAVALAYEATPELLGSGLGINLRVAPYAGVANTVAETFRSSIGDVARGRGAEIFPLPISACCDGRDDQAIDGLLKGLPAVRPLHPAWKTPAGAIAVAGQCRIVVTGSYHAAVFALSQGVSAVCLSGSSYYSDKFLGLAELFGRGCSVIDLNGLDLGLGLHSAMEQAWAEADLCRAPLLIAAAAQSEAVRQAYARLGASTARPKSFSIAA